jgi:hypothetical protein
MVPAYDEEFPTLGPQVCDWIETFLVYGPGDLRGQPVRLDDETKGLIYRMYEVYPRDHPEVLAGRQQAGRRRFKRVALSMRKGTAKTEKAAMITAVELHPDGPVRCDGFDAFGQPVGRGVTDPYIPLVAYTEEMSDELAYAALKAILEESTLAGDFDIGLERILRKPSGAGRAVSLATSPNARDGARTTFQVFDECLDIETPLPTAQGWKTIGEIKSGAEVYGRDGEPVRVIGVSDVHFGRPCYRVTFVGGDSVVTDAGHRWKVTDWGNRPRGEQLRTTEEMYRAGMETGYGKRWRLPRDNGYEGAPAALPIDPYVLGYWLGNGDTDSGHLHAGEADAAEIQELIRGAGYEIQRSDPPGRGSVRFLPRGLRAQLRQLGVFGAKQIPPAYLEASRAQRLALLSGLMDSDGYTTERGSCTFVQCRPELAAAVRTLVRSLGAPASLVADEESRARSGFTYKVHFSPLFCPFKLARKAALCPGTARRSTRWPAIESVEPVASVPVRCIAVDSEDHLFLVGDGLRLTHNTHRLILPRQRQAHQTMLANIPKRFAADAWSLEVTTAYLPGENSVAEKTHELARAIDAGKVKDQRFFFFHRQASDEHDITLREGARAAVIEASGPAAAWSDIESIVDMAFDPTTDLAYWERVWCNRPRQAALQAFSVERWRELAVEQPGYRPEPGALITLGFDGSRREDATGIIGTEVASGIQFRLGGWEMPVPRNPDWEVPESEVDAVMADAFATWEVWRLYMDPPYWETRAAEWAGRFGEKKVVAWRTNQWLKMAYAVRAFTNAISDGDVKNDGDADLGRHIGNARKLVLNLRDDKGERLHVITKERPDSPFKIDYAVAAVLSWQARNDAIADGALNVDVGFSIYVPGEDE